MLDLNDPLWESFDGGYRMRYDASVPLRLLQSGDADRDEIWEELAENLHHQDDIGIASYAAVPHLVSIYIKNHWVDWKVFALVGWIEAARHSEDNPPVPNWLADSYRAAIRDLYRFGKDNVAQDSSHETRFCFLSLSAFALNLPSLGRLLTRVTSEAEIDELL